MKTINVINEAHGKEWSLYHADCVDFASQMPDECIDLTIYSPPFAALYVYSDSVADMGNCKDDEEFFEQYRFLMRGCRDGFLISRRIVNEDRHEPDANYGFSVPCHRCPISPAKKKVRKITKRACNECDNAHTVSHKLRDTPEAKTQTETRK